MMQPFTGTPSAHEACSVLLEPGERLPPRILSPVIAIGNFDGLHRGHQAVVAHALELGKRFGRPTALLTFEPNPRAFFFPEKPFFCLTPPAVKATLAARFGLSASLVMPFDERLAAMEAEAFINDILIGALDTRGIAVGEDFRFGARRAGSAEMLKAEAARWTVPVSIVSPVFLEKTSASSAHSLVSSSLIRLALSQGDVTTANRALGFTWFVRGIVQAGAQKGRTLGFPTANLRLSETTALRHGIYAVQIRIGSKVHDGVASFGRRPTFDNGAPLLEAYLFDFAGDLYGVEIDIAFVDWIRPEVRFDSPEALVVQMTRDAQDARRLLLFFANQIADDTTSSA